MCQSLWHQKGHTSLVLTFLTACPWWLCSFPSLCCPSLKAEWLMVPVHFSYIFLLDLIMPYCAQCYATEGWPGWVACIQLVLPVPVLTVLYVTAYVNTQPSGQANRNCCPLTLFQYRIAFHLKADDPRMCNYSYAHIALTLILDLDLDLKIYPVTKNEVPRSKHSKIRAQTGHGGTVFCSSLPWPWTWLDDLDSKLDLGILMMFLVTKNEVSWSRAWKLEPEQDTNIDASDRTYCHGAVTVGKSWHGTLALSLTWECWWTLNWQNCHFVLCAMSELLLPWKVTFVDTVWIRGLHGPKLLWPGSTRYTLVAPI